MNKPALFSLTPDFTPKYTVKQVAEMLELSSHTIRYYDSIGLIPQLDRTDGNIRMFSEYTMSWVALVHCLRSSGLPIEGVKRYIKLCKIGDSTILDREKLILDQEVHLQELIAELHHQLDVLLQKKEYYRELKESKGYDTCNPKTALDYRKQQRQKIAQ
ncbi:MAG: MerR family transcriptional regulator [Lentisphaeria bacterium]|nr:MerR family transcriptional regulator [Lentisphaeria bacterium]